MNFSRQDLGMLFDRFRALYGWAGAWALQHESSKEATTFTQEWWKRLKGMPQERILAGADYWITENHAKWPTLGELWHCVKLTEPRRLGIPPDPFDPDACACGTEGCRWRWYRVREGVERRMTDCDAARRNLLLGVQ